MADRWAFVVAVDKPLHPGVGPTPYAEAGARALADALTAAGYPRDRQVVLLGPHATRAAVDSRLRKLKQAAGRGDPVLAVWAGRAVGDVLACWDALPDDLPNTGLPAAEFVAAVAGTGRPAVFLFDAAGGLELAGLFADKAQAVALTACSPGETSHATAALKGTAWLHVVAEAVCGRGRVAVGGGGVLSAEALQRFVEAELPRVLRKHLDPPADQTPQLVGDAGVGLAVADLSARLAEAAADGPLDAGRLKRVAFRTEGRGRVKDLSGFRKTFSVPDNAGPANRKFAARVAAPDLKADLDAVLAAAREHLGYKRRDVEVTAEADDGFGAVRGPDFEYTVAVALDPDDPSQVVWRREVGGFADPGFVRSAGFDAVFGKLFDQLAFEFAGPVDVAALVDRLEDRPPPGVRVRVDADGSACDVTLAGFVGRVTVGRTGLTVRGRAGDTVGLLDQLLRFLSAVGPVGEPLALPPAGP